MLGNAFLVTMLTRPIPAPAGGGIFEFMQDDSRESARFSSNALHVFGVLARRGGLMRIYPLLRSTGLAPDALAGAVNELAERGWVKTEWRHPRARLPADLPDRFREVDRVTTTAFGRWRYPVTWSTR